MTLVSILFGASMSLLMLALAVDKFYGMWLAFKVIRAREAERKAMRELREAFGDDASRINIDRYLFDENATHK